MRKSFLDLASALIATFVFVDATQGAEQPYEPIQFFPNSVEEALKALPRSMSEAKDWDAFGTLSTTTYRKQGHDEKTGSYDRRLTTTYFPADQNDVAHLSVSVQGDSTGTGETSGRVEIKKADAEFDPKSLRYIGTEAIAIGKRSYTAKVYEMEKTHKILDGVLITRFRLWMVPKIPNGIAKSESFQIESTEVDRPSGHSTFRITDINVPIEAAGKKFISYCVENETETPDGEKVLNRAWKSAAVPGGIVRANERITRNGVEEFDDTELVEFEAVRPVAPEVFERNLRLNEARGLLQMGDVEQSIAAFNDVLSSGVDFPGRAGAYNDRGWAKWTAHDAAGAIADFAMAMQIDPKLPDPYNNRAFARLESNDLNGALNDFDRAIKLNPRFARAYGGRAIVYMRMNKDNKAVKDYQTALSIAPTLKKSLDEKIAQARKDRKR